jgi:hypothetical protein
MSGNDENIPQPVEQPIEQPVEEQPTTLVQMPALGLYGLAQELYPEDRGDQTKMRLHIEDLFQLNTDRLRDDVSHTVGQMVRIPVVTNAE